MKVFARKQNQTARPAPVVINRPETKAVASLQGTNGNQANASATGGFAHDFSKIAVHSREPPKLRAKLMTNAPGDVFEQEADRVAEQVTNTPEPKVAFTDENRIRVTQSADSLQRQESPQQRGPTTGVPLGFEQNFHKMIEDWSLMYEFKAPIVEELAEGYVNRSHGKPVGMPISPTAKPAVTREPGQSKPPISSPRTVTSYSELTPEQAPNLEPTKAEVVLALHNGIDLKKMGKGNRREDWDWRDSPAKAKNRDEKLQEIGEFALNELVQDKIQNAVVKTALTWATDGSLVATATFSLSEAAAAAATTMFAIEIIGFASLVIGINELLKSLDAPVELTAIQQKRANIVADVKDWWQRKQEGVDLEERMKNPLKFDYKQMPAATTRIGP